MLENGIEALAVKDTNILGKELGNDKPRTHYWKKWKETRPGSGVWERVDNFSEGSDDCK
jgi:hypothetical protein